MYKIKRKIALYKNIIFIYFNFLFKINFFKSNKQEIVICFDGNTQHGGLVDRLKGIISFFEISKKKNINFKIYHTTPFNLNLFLDPNEHDWTIEKIEINPLYDKILYRMNNFNFNNIENKISKRGTTFVYCNVDYLKDIYKFKTDSQLNELWRNNYNKLFKKSIILEKAINNINVDKRIVIHTRFTSLMGDFKDSTKNVLDINERNRLLIKILNSIKQLNFEKTLPIYFVSDSITFLNFISKNTEYNILNGIPSHIDIVKKQNYLENEMINNNLKTFTDFYFISESEKVYLIKLDGMHNSAFSKYASVIGDKQFIIIKDD